MLQRPKIRHLKALNVDKINLEGQSHITIRHSSGALFVKSVLFRKNNDHITYYSVIAYAIPLHSFAHLDSNISLHNQKSPRGYYYGLIIESH